MLELQWQLSAEAVGKERPPQARQSVRVGKGATVCNPPSSGVGEGGRRSPRARWACSQEPEARKDGSPAGCEWSAPSAQGVSQLNEPKEAAVLKKADKAKLSLLDKC